jgi:adenylate cyclase
MGPCLISARGALTAVAAIVALAWSALLAGQHLDGRATPLDRMEATLADLRFLIVGPRPAPAGVVIVAIDDDTVREAGRYPLSRTRLARLVRELSSQGPKAIAIDLLFLDPAAPEADEALASALRDARAVIAAAAVFAPGAGTLETGGPLANVPAAARVLWPVERLRQVAGIGVVNLSADRSGIPRHVPLVVRDGESLVPSFAVRAVAAAERADPELSPERARIGAAAMPVDLGMHMALRFYGPRGSVPTVSAAPILRGEATPDLGGRILVVGATATGTGDSFATPFDPVLPGVEVLATAIANIVAGDALNRTVAVRRLDAAAAVVLAVLTVLLLSMRRIGLGLVLVAAGSVAWAAVTVVGFMSGAWLSMALPLFAAIPPALILVGARLWLDRRTERRLEAIQEAFRRFHPPALADHLAAAPDFLSSPVPQNAAVLFIDLSGFTGVSERLGPERSRELLKGFHPLIEAEVTAENGLVLSYMGDGAMIVFGLPAPRPDDAARALKAAVALGWAVEGWLGTLPDTIGGSLGVRLGAHYGPVVASRLGADTHQHITATGDCVNVASRLLGVAAAEGAVIAASTDLLDRARDAGSNVGQGFGDEKQVDIRGRAHPLSIRLWRRLFSGETEWRLDPAGC